MAFESMNARCCGGTLKRYFKPRIPNDKLQAYTCYQHFRSQFTFVQWLQAYLHVYSQCFVVYMCLVLLHLNPFTHSTMRMIPPEVLLSWPTPNYANPKTQGNALVIVNSVFVFLVLVVAGLRLYTRAVIKRWFGADDVFMGLAMVNSLHILYFYILPLTRCGMVSNSTVDYGDWTCHLCRSCKPKVWLEQACLRHPA